MTKSGELFEEWDKRNKSDEYFHTIESLKRFIGIVWSEKKDISAIYEYVDYAYELGKQQISFDDYVDKVL
jgi:hypothetical protein